MDYLNKANSLGAAGALKLRQAAYQLVETGQDAVSNGIRLANALAGLSSAKPDGVNPPSEAYRFTLYLMPGRYQLPTEGVVLNTPFVDVIGLGAGPADVWLTSDGFGLRHLSGNNGLQNFTLETTYIGANSPSMAEPVSAYFPESHTGTVMRKVVALATGTGYPHRPAVSFRGLYEDCEAHQLGGGNNFAFSGGLLWNWYPEACEASGTFVRCRATSIGSGVNESFGAAMVGPTGKFYDCVASSENGNNNSFGGGNGVKGSAYFEKCLAAVTGSGTNYAFAGYYAYFLGTAIDCEATTTTGTNDSFTGRGGYIGSPGDMPDRDVPYVARIIRCRKRSTTGALRTAYAGRICNAIVEDFQHISDSGSYIPPTNIGFIAIPGTPAGYIEPPLSDTLVKNWRYSPGVVPHATIFTSRLLPKARLVDSEWFRLHEVSGRVQNCRLRHPSVGISSIQTGAVVLDTHFDASSGSNAITVTGTTTVQSVRIHGCTAPIRGLGPYIAVAPGCRNGFLSSVTYTAAGTQTLPAPTGGDMMEVNVDLSTAAATSTLTLNLPAIEGATFRVKDLGAATATRIIVINPPAGMTIEGAANLTLNAPYQCRTLRVQTSLNRVILL